MNWFELAGESRWIFPAATELPWGEDLAFTGGDLEPPTLAAAYASGYFPMPVTRFRIGWFSPNPRGVLPLGGLRVSRSLRRSLRRYEVTVDTDFAAVIEACGDPDRPHGWISGRVTRAYKRLHEMGLAHSVETWEGDTLVGGLYGVSMGGLFAGESMFHRANDASKVALVTLVELLGPDPDRLLDVQWQTPHLASLGVTTIPRDEYLRRLPAALRRPDPFGH